MALNLPKPVHSYAGEDELRHVNGREGEGAEAELGDMGEYQPPKHSDKFKVGMIYPAPDVRKIIDKTAAAIVRAPALEEKVREQQKTDPRFSFFDDEDPYNQYYKWRRAVCEEEREAGVRPSVGTPGGSATPVPVPAAEQVDPQLVGYEPKSWDFKVDLPGVTAGDLDILRLTALFHARRGRSFLSALSVREGRNYQFDFLRPTHSLYGYYNRMVESYQKVIQPPPGLVDELVKTDADPDAKWKTLAEARKRALWEASKRKREDEKAKERDEEAKVFATIDWQDFVTVETIEFTQADMDLALPPPTSIDKLRQMSMAERRMAAMIMEEPVNAGEEDIVEEVDMEEDDEEDEEARTQRIKEEKEQARAREVQRAALEKKGLRIKKDHVSKGIQRGGPAAMAKCPNCGQLIPENELSEHIRIELLDPRWKEQRRDIEQRRQQQAQLQIGADISTSLRNLAAARTDLFGDEEDEATRKRREEEAAKKRKEREKIIWDGHTNSASKVETTFQSRFSAEDNARRLREAQGITDTPVNTVGPQLGPGIQAQKGAPAPTPLAPATAGQTISAQPTRGAAAGTRSSRRRAEDDGAAAPAAKRQRVDKLPDGQLYSEIDWMSLHPAPIAVAIQLPDMPEKPEWKLNGSIVTLPDVPVNMTFGALRERIKRAVDADLPVSRLRLDYNAKVMNNSASLASVNLGEGDMLVMSVRKK